jgi:outer membrane beta-barrel protein
MKYLVLILLSFSVGSGSLALADNEKIDLKKDFSSLGDNDAVLQRAKALDPKNKYKVVQGRAVDMNMRLEVGANVGTFSGGDPYYSAFNLGANLDFHINPNWSVGGRYYHAFNNLSAEGQMASSNQGVGVGTNAPVIDYATDTTLGVVSWYPIYGKLDLFGNVTHFDIYLLGGYGVTTLNSGPAGTFAAGGGFGLWLTQHITMRLEARYQAYDDHPYYNTPAAYTNQINEVVYMSSIGFLL